VNRDVVQFAKFVAVGLVNTAFAFCLYSALLYVGLPYALANLTALVIGIGVSFMTQGGLVFENRESGRLARFVAVWAVLYFVSIFLISRFIALGFDPYAAGALALPFSTLLSFIAQKFLVFRAAPSKRDADSRGDTDG
jgi:putative flippase GtrA